MDMMKNFIRVANNMVFQIGEILLYDISHEISALGILIKSSLSDSKNSLPDCWYSEYTAAKLRGN
jgi:hypothetical protein